MYIAIGGTSISPPLNTQQLQVTKTIWRCCLVLNARRKTHVELVKNAVCNIKYTNYLFYLLTLVCEVMLVKINKVNQLENYIL